MTLPFNIASYEVYKIYKDAFGGILQLIDCSLIKDILKIHLK